VQLELEPFYVFFEEQEPEVLHKNQELPKTVSKLPGCRYKRQQSRGFTMVIVHYEYRSSHPSLGKVIRSDKTTIGF
jgi:hypothetical protein